VIMILIWPGYIFAVSFQLSVLATLGIIWIVPKITQVTSGLSGFFTNDISLISAPASSVKSPMQSMANLLKESFIITLSAQSLVLPLVWFHFQEFSLMSIVANTVLSWVTPIITISGMLGVFSLLLSTMFPQVQSVVALFVVGGLWLPIQVFIQGTLWLGSFDQALLQLPVLDWKGVFIWWFLLGVIIRLVKK